MTRQAMTRQALRRLAFSPAGRRAARAVACRFLLLALAMWAAPRSPTVAAGGELELRAVDKESQQPLAVRMHLKDQRGNVVLPRGQVAWRTHFVFDGKTVLDLPVGNYTFEIERGPEYRTRSGYFTIERGATDNKTIEMERFVDMKKEGWWSGELHIHRDLEDIELLMRAEDLHVGPVITWWNKTNPWTERPVPRRLVTPFDSNRYYQVLAGEDERGGGALLYFNLPRPLEITDAQREFPSSAEYLMRADDRPDVHVDVEKPFWWDMPVWVASGRVDSMGIAHNHMWRDGVLPNEAWGNPRDKSRHPDPHGNARWSLEIYYRLLDCGLRIPPSAGSASGVLPNPVGYNRVYVHCGEELSYEKWWDGLRAGRVVVTNGPLLRNPRANGELPGHVFRAGEGETVELNLQLNLSTRDRIEYLEVVKNGEVAHEVRLADWAGAGGKLPPVRFDRSGWVLVRAIATNSETFRFASTGPFHVQIGDSPRISKRAAEFFRDWVRTRATQIKLDDPARQEQVIKYHRAAFRFWRDKVDQANAE